VSYLELSPTFSVVAAESLDSSNSLSTPFVISNYGLLPVHNIRVHCSINQIERYDTPDLIGPIERANVVSERAASSTIMRRNESMTVMCPLNYAISSPVRRADIAISISFYPAIPLPLVEKAIPYELHNDFRFCTRLAANGHPRWLQQPLAKHC
jgi:hypothetical protein